MIILKPTAFLCRVCDEEKPVVEKVKKANDPCCKPCAAQVQREWRLKNRTHVRAYQATWKKNNPDVYRNSRLLHHFGISIDDYNDMEKSQGQVCAICEEPETAVLNGVVKRMAVDHCHKTGVVRGLLCAKCNTVLGTVNDDIERLEAMIKYLISAKER